MKYNSANRGGALYGGGNLEDCVLIGNDAANGGAAYASSPTTLTRCTIAEGGASQQGGAVCSFGTTIEVRDSLIRGFSADASGGATTLVYAERSLALAVLDRVTWSNNELDAVASRDEATIVVRNNEGLAAADVQGAALLGCGDHPAIIDHCSLEAQCTDVATGITCFCFPDNVQTDPALGACASSGEMSGLLLGSEKTQLLSLNKDNGIATTSFFFPNTGDVFIAWGLAVTDNAKGLNWTASSTNGTLEAGEIQEIVLSLDLTYVQARGSEYSTELTLNTSSPSPTPFPISSTTSVVVSVIVSASASAAKSVITMTNLANLTASGTMEFIVDSIDAAGVSMLDVSDVVYFGELSTESNTGDVTNVVACSIVYSATADHHVGTCPMPALATGGFALTVLLGSELVGGSTHIFTVDRCPDSYVSDDGGGSCTCAAGQYELAGTCVTCAENHAKPSLGTDKAGCDKCETVIGEAPNAAHTACDACIAGYYSKRNACVQCPNYPMSCVENSVLMPGYWRAAATSGDNTEVLICRFGEVSCPGTTIIQSSEDSSTCLSTNWHHCACGYAGPTCAVCDSNDASGRFYMAWTSGKCESCDDSTSLGPTVGLASVLFAAGLTTAALAFTKRKRIKSRHAYQLIHRIYRIGKVKLSIIIFAFQARPQLATRHNILLCLTHRHHACRQVISQFSSVVMSASVSSDDAGGYPSSAATFAAGLGMSNFDLASFVPAACLFPATTFYDKLLFSTLAPLVPIALLWLPAFKKRITGTHSTSAEQSAARWSMFLLEFIVSSVSTTVVQTFSCDTYDDGMFMRAELALKCDGSDERRLYLAYAWVALLAYPIGTPPRTWRTQYHDGIRPRCNISPPSPQVFLFSSL